jgi:hypothetical protein
MGIYFRYAKFAIVWMVVLFLGRIILGARGVPYEQGTHIFSMVTFSYIAALFYGAFSRRLWGLKAPQAMLTGAAIALSGQVLIFLATVFSYVAGVDTYFNHPTALNVPEAIPLTQALGARGLGLVINPHRRLDRRAHRLGDGKAATGQVLKPDERRRA